MPRFFFHLRNDIAVDDEEGHELANVPSAHQHAIESARTMVCASVQEGHLNLDHYIFVTDEAGQEVTRVTFRDAFTIEG